MKSRIRNQDSLKGKTIRNAVPESCGIKEIVPVSCRTRRFTDYNETSMRRSLSLTIANWILIPAFFLSVAVQYNDPDPLRWIAIYGVAAVVSSLWLAGRLNWLFAACIAVIAFVWAMTIVPDLIGKDIPMNEVFGHMRMANEAVEEAREMGGLLIVASWMTVLSFSSKRTGGAKIRTPGF